MGITTMKTFFHALPVLLALATTTALAAEDCSRPRTIAERLICSNDRVSEAKEQMSVAFFMAYRRQGSDAGRDTMRRQQQAFEAKIREGCTDVPCLLNAYADRALELDQN
jgi:uncharacterized protein